MLVKAKLNTIEVLRDSNISHVEFFSIDVLREYNEMKEEIKNSNNEILNMFEVIRQILYLFY